MQFRRLLGVATLCLLPVICQGQPNALVSQQDGSYQVRYASNLSATNDTIVNFTNTGAAWNQILSIERTPINPANICVSIYVYTPDEQLQECCNVSISPNSLWSASAFKELIASPVGISPLGFSNIVIKMMATSTNSGVAACPTSPNGPFTIAGYPFNGAATMGQYLPAYQQGTVGVNPNTGAVGFGPSYLVWGLAAWAKTPTTETPFTNSVLSGQEWYRNTQLCEFIRVNGSGPGICHVTRGGQ